MTRAWLPLLVFAILVVFLAIGLGKDPKEVPSPFIGKPAPVFTLPQLHNTQLSFNPESMKGKVWLLNVWASWCFSCRAEHEVLNELVKNKKINLVGLNYKDQAGDAKRWLQRYGDPYQLSVSDIKGRIGIDWGVYGVPETFVMDKQGIVRMKHIGPLTSESVEQQLIPLLTKLENQS
jgi:cytochrome c biogenesis protein CcmG/thiol:disulfide interchange protein DsbE